MINEWKSVSDDVINNTNSIANRIFQDVKGRGQHYGKYTREKCQQGYFTYETSGKDLHVNLLVEYTIYYVDDEKSYNVLLNRGTLNCYADETEDGYCINIVLVYVKGVLKQDFIDTLAHELNHILQTSNGSVKNISLYNNVINIINSETLNNIQKSPAYLLYYLFKNEQDSFVAQFYSHLKSINFKSKPRKTGDFEKALNMFDVYCSIKNCKRMFDEAVNETMMNNVYEKLGLTKEETVKRINVALYRIRNKLHNAYVRYFIERERLLNMENFVRWQISLTEENNRLLIICENAYKIEGQE